MCCEEEKVTKSTVWIVRKSFAIRCERSESRKRRKGIEKRLLEVKRCCCLVWYGWGIKCVQKTSGVMMRIGMAMKQEKKRDPGENKTRITGPLYIWHGVGNENGKNGEQRMGKEHTCEVCVCWCAEHPWVLVCRSHFPRQLLQALSWCVVARTAEQSA